MLSREFTIKSVMSDFIAFGNYSRCPMHEQEATMEKVRDLAIVKTPQSHQNPAALTLNVMTIINSGNDNRESAERKRRVAPPHSFEQLAGCQ